MKAFEWQGYWWLPQKQDAYIPGLLAFSPESGADLKLLGSFERGGSDPHGRGRRYIHGVQDHGRKVTLYRCLQANWSTSLGNQVPAFSASSYGVGYVLLGHHFYDEPEPVFSKLQVGYDHLADWARVSGLRTELVAHSEQPPHEFRAFYTFPDDVREVELPGCTIRFTHIINTPVRIDEVHWKEDIFWEVEPDTPQPWSWFQRSIMQHLQNLLSFGLGVPVYETRVRGTLLGGTPEALGEPVEIFFGRPPFAEPHERLRERGVLFRLRDLGESYPHVLRSWFQQAEELRPVFSLYFANVFAPRMYFENLFLNLVQALEIYHSRTRDIRYVPRDRFRPLRDQVVDLFRQAAAAVPDSSAIESSAAHDQIPQDFLDALPNRLGFLNQPSLRTRLQQLATELQTEIGAIVPDLTGFVSKVTSTRHHFTHYGEDEPTNVLPLTERPTSAAILKLMLELCLLKEIGVPDAVLARISADRGWEIRETRMVSYD